VEIDESLDLSAARTVRLAGRDFYVWPPSLRQILAIADHVPKLSGITAELVEAAVKWAAGWTLSHFQ
jgi:hypothetical protein